MQEENNQTKDQEEKLVEREYFFPTYQVTVWATSKEDAEQKLKIIVNKTI